MLPCSSCWNWRNCAFLVISENTNWSIFMRSKKLNVVCCVCRTNFMDKYFRLGLPMNDSTVAGIRFSTDFSASKKRENTSRSGKWPDALIVSVLRITNIKFATSFKLFDAIASVTWIIICHILVTSYMLFVNNSTKYKYIIFNKNFYVVIAHQ